MSLTEKYMWRTTLNVGCAMANLVFLFIMSMLKPHDPWIFFYAAMFAWCVVAQVHDVRKVRRALKENPRG